MEHDTQISQMIQMEQNDTICAISTPHGIGGIAVVRISGPNAFVIADKIWKGNKISLQKSHTAHLGTIVNPEDNLPLDQAIATVFIAPGSFTGENVVELSIHGSNYIQSKIIEILTQNGCRLAQPGEFTRRAFAAGNLDLAQAEAIADIIASNSQAAHRLAMNQMRGGFSQKLTQLRQKLLEIASLVELELDFSEEDVEFASRQNIRAIASQIHEEVSQLYQSFRHGQAIKNGIPVAIAGATNAGKSSLLNALLNDNRAIVSDIHGTTRDTIEDQLDIDGFTFRLIDTAGLRSTDDSIEQLGINRSYKAIEKAEIMILVIDSSTPLPSINDTVKRTSASKIIVALNKTDLTENKQTIKNIMEFAESNHDRITLVKICANNGYGIDTLRNKLAEHANIIQGGNNNQILITNARHAEALHNASLSTAAMIEGLDNQLPHDLIAEHMRETLYHLGTITGAITSPEILNTIFTRFCIGK